MRVLLVFVLACSVAGGRFVDKCELKAQMMEAAKGNQKGLATENFMLGSGFNTDAVNETSPRIGEQLWRFYGLFQLGNRLACSDGTTSSPNVCQKDCESFLDDDIDDDLQCLLEIFTSLLYVFKKFTVDLLHLLYVAR
uniref:Glycosyl hydrolases family 22 (GH22) domain-containing protein n=1 Tax=Mola mola TaxID=94237 RepID=A0A3Q3XLB8_MOLML